MRAPGWAEELGWLARGVPPRRIGYGEGPLTAVRRARHGAQRRPFTVCLLDATPVAARLAPAQAFWINSRSRTWRAVVDEPAAADLLWVFTEDPLAPDTHAELAAAIARARPGTPVLNPLETYDAYHRADCFERLAAAGVRVPPSRFGPADVGRTPVVYKEAGTQGGRKVLAPYDGPRAGMRTFGFEDGRGPDGRVRRYRAFFLAGEVLAETVIVSAHWESRQSTLVDAELTFEPTGHEVDQIRRLGRTLGLDWFADDYLRRRGDGLPIFLDVNVYPTVQLRGWMPGDRGWWHVFELPARLGRRWPGGRPYWAVVDAALLRAARRDVFP